MINGVKITLVYHLYAKDTDSFQKNIYAEINRRCLSNFSGVFDECIICIAIDDLNNIELIEQAIKWILSTGLKNLCIKIKKNTAYGDAQTFFDEVVENLHDIDGLVFFGHCKGITYNGEESNMESLKQWITFSYYACLDKIKEHVNNIMNNYAAMTYVQLLPREEKLTKYGYIPTGTFFLFSPQKIAAYAKSHEEEIPRLIDRYSAEFFLPNIIDKSVTANAEIGFECNTQLFSIPNCKEYNPLFMNHVELISYFLDKKRVKEYCNFYNKINDGL